MSATNALTVSSYSLLARAAPRVDQEKEDGIRFVIGVFVACLESFPATDARLEEVHDGQRSDTADASEHTTRRVPVEGVNLVMRFPSIRFT